MGIEIPEQLKRGRLPPHSWGKILVRHPRGHDGGGHLLAGLASSEMTALNTSVVGRPATIEGRRSMELLPGQTPARRDAGEHVGSLAGFQ